MAERFVTRLAVFVIVRNKNDEILLQQRANTGYLDGFWDFPSGHVEYGESIQAAAARELKEEVDIDTPPEALRLVHIDQYFMDKDYVNFIFVASEWHGIPAIGEPEKVSNMRFFAPDALPEKCVNMVRVAEHTGFSNELTYSVVNSHNWQQLMGAHAGK